MVEFLTFLIMKNEMDYLLQMINVNIFTYSYENQLDVKYSWLCSEANTQKLHVSIFLSHFTGLLVSGNSLFEHFVLKKPKSLFYPSWTPWNTDEYFMTTFSMQIVLALCACWLMFVTQLFMIFVTIEFSRQNTRLCAALTSIQQQAENTVSLKMTKIKGNKIKLTEKQMKMLLAMEFENNLKQCIRHHQMLTK